MPAGALRVHVTPPSSLVFLCGAVGQSEAFPLTPLHKLLPLTSSSHRLLRQMALALQSRLLWLHDDVCGPLKW